MKKSGATSAARLVAIGFFVAAALVGLCTAYYFRAPPSRQQLFSLAPLPQADQAGQPSDVPLGGHLSRALGAGSVLWGRTPSKLVRRSFVDQGSGLEVVEESAYFDVPQGEGEELVSAVQAEQAASTSAGKVDDIVLLRKRKVGPASGAEAAEEPAGAVAAAVEETRASGGGTRGGAVAAAAAAAAEVAKAGAAAAAPAPASLPLPLAPVPVPPVAAAPASLPWSPLLIPTRPSDWVEPQRPIPGERDSVPPSGALAGSKIASLSPPSPPSHPAAAEELSHRLVIAIAMGVHSGGLVVPSPGDAAALAKTPLIKVMLATFLPTAQPHHEYRFYFAYDHNDPVYEVAANREALAAMYAARVREEDALRWHPPGSSTAGGALDGSRLHLSVHWVHCDYHGKPGWAHSDASVAAVLEGADYVYRSNDDTEFPKLGDWADRWVRELRSRSPVPNIGVTGPTCNEGATW